MAGSGSLAPSQILNWKLKLEVETECIQFIVVMFPMITESIEIWNEAIVCVLCQMSINFCDSCLDQLDGEPLTSVNLSSLPQSTIEESEIRSREKSKSDQSFTGY